jgi:type II secretory pathway pseudopilin PulG
MAAIADSFKSVQKLWAPLLIATGIIFLAAGLAVPNLLRSRRAADESGRFQALSHLYASAQTENSALSDPAPVSLQRAAVAAVKQSAAAGAAPNAAAATADREIVRTGALELTVKSPADAAEQIRRMAESMGGYLETAQIGGTKEVPTADISIRVPATHFEDAKAQIRRLATRVESEKTDAQDVTRQYVDMEARLRNLRAEEAQYLTIMKSAYKVDDLLEVTQKLSEVRGQIEQQQAELQTLAKQVETVAITIALRTLADTQIFGLNWRPLYQLKVALRNGLDALADYATTMAAILFYVPVILAWSISILFAAIVGWRALRWTGRRFFDWPALTPQKAANPA